MRSNQVNPFDYPGPPAAPPYPPQQAYNAPYQASNPYGPPTSNAPYQAPNPYGPPTRNAPYQTPYNPYGPPPPPTYPEGPAPFPTSVETPATPLGTSVPPSATPSRHSVTIDQSVKIHYVYVDDLISRPRAEDNPTILVHKLSCLWLISLTTLLALIGTVVLLLHEMSFGPPPTQFSYEAYTNTSVATFMIFAVCFVSRIILGARLRDAALGYLIMFFYVVTLFCCMKGISRAVLSLEYDDISTIEKHVFNETSRFNGELPSFFHNIQSTFQCCGTTRIDKMEDWPVRLNTDNMPRSCCKLPHKNCGRGLARTRHYRGMYNDEPMRMPSGFFLTLSDKEMDHIVKEGKPIKIIRAPGTHDGTDVLLKILHKFYYERLTARYPPGTHPARRRQVQNDIVWPYKDLTEEGGPPKAIGCSDPEAKDKATTIGWKIQMELDRETTQAYFAQGYPFKYDLMAWKIPICNEPEQKVAYHLAANLNRTDLRQMWYISRGIAENFILRNTLWDNFCENEDLSVLLPIEYLEIPFLEVNNTKSVNSPFVGQFFISFVKQLMVFCKVIGALEIVLLFIVFLIFWKHYSKMRLEKYANLPFPPEFEELGLQQEELYVAKEKQDSVRPDREPAPPPSAETTEVEEPTPEQLRGRRRSVTGYTPWDKEAILGEETTT